MTERICDCPPGTIKGWRARLDTNTGEETYYCEWCLLRMVEELHAKAFPGQSKKLQKKRSQ